MKRCKYCIMPLSHDDGYDNKKEQCIWCASNFPNYKPKGEKALEDALNLSRNITGAADCLVALSGGKDSTYSLIQLKQKYNMRVEAFTYVHEGSAAFSIENAVHTCKSLNIKHHIVSLPNEKHLNSFKSFFDVWCNTENKLAAALSCVACKHLNILGAKIAKRRSIPMIVWAPQPLEFFPYSIIKRGSKQLHRESMGKSFLYLLKAVTGSLSLSKALLKNFFTCLHGCMAFYPTTTYYKIRFPTLTNLFFFDYIPWNKDKILNSIRGSVTWKTPANIITDWHSDCKFNVFKEYMYQKMMGISYTDAFLSNQIRYGLITREEAWVKLLESKRFYAEELKRCINELGPKGFSSLIDYSCFRIE